MNAMKLTVPLLVLQRFKLRPAKRGFERTSATAPLMRANSGVLSKRSGVLSAGTLSALLALAGCAGGGGGSGGVPPAGFSYPPSLVTATSTDTVGGFVAPYALDATPELRSVPQTVVATGAVNGQLTFTVAAIELPSGPSPEPGFVVTFDPASGSTLLDTPLDSLGCAGCLKTDIVQAGGGAGPVTFTYLDPTNVTFSLKYSTLGMWSKPSTVSLSWQEVGGPFSAGVLTRGIDLPTLGGATYNGYFIGRYATSDTSDVSFPAVGTYLVGANAQADVTFSGAGSVIFSTSDTMITGGGLTTPEPRLDLTSTVMPISRGQTSNLFTGTLTNGLNMTGEIKGGFFGPPATTTPFAPPELGGSLAVAKGLGIQTMVGSFALKIQTPP